MGSNSVTYSFANDFNGSYSGGQMQDEVEASAMTQTLVESEMVGDVLTMTFDAPVTGADLTTLNGLVAAHVPEALSARFIRNIGDADATISNKEFTSQHVRAPTTAPRTYSFKKAVKMIENGFLGGDFYLINTGSANATIAMKAGGTLYGSGVVEPGTSGHFRYRVTDTSSGNEAMRVLRL